MLAKIWRFLCCLADWRGIARIIFHLPFTVFVTNMRDAKDRQTFLGKWHPPDGHFNGPRYWIKWVCGRTRALDIIADEMKGPEGIKKARGLFLKTTAWAVAKNAKVVLAAADTKRLFEEDPETLRQAFPETVFTIGDNGTFLLLKGETIRALSLAGLQAGKCRVAVIGPYGFLGRSMTKALVEMGYNIIGIGPNIQGLAEIHDEFGIETCQTFDELGIVDAVVACTHSNSVRLMADNVDLIRQQGHKLLVIDVCEPSNMTYREWQKCKNKIIRQDAGNAYAPKLKYVLGAISYRMFRLTRGVTFGCFAEALALAWAMKHGYEQEVCSRNWFTVNEDNMAFTAMLFEQMGFTMPSPRCFGRPIPTFSLDFVQAAVEEKYMRLPKWKVALHRLGLL